jgi:REP-associated tyrosine transposase
MSDDQTLHPGHRSVRLKFYNYSTPGLYFVTICAHRRRCIFSQIVGGEVHLSQLARIIEETWMAIPSHFPSVHLHSFVTTPNHVHGILEITNRPNTRTDRLSPDSKAPYVNPCSLGAIVRSFKVEVTRQARQQLHWQTEIWQRNYFERIIRDVQEFANATIYIAENPLRWQWDQENPDRASSTPLSQPGRSKAAPLHEKSRPAAPWN